MTLKVQAPDREGNAIVTAFKEVAMRNALRLMWVVGMLGVLGFLLHEKGAAQSELRPPMPPHLFTIHKLTAALSIIAPAGPDMSQVGGNIGVFVSDEGVLVVDDNYYTQVRGGQTVKLAEAVVAEIRKLTTQPVRFIVNTHHPLQRALRAAARRGNGAASARP